MVFFGLFDSYFAQAKKDWLANQPTIEQMDREMYERIAMYVLLTSVMSLFAFKFLRHENLFLANFILQQLI
jgi:hypothetical protein